MNAPVTRRALLGATAVATAAVGAAGMPVVVQAAPADPDAGLLDLIARWPGRHAAYVAAGERSAPLWDLFLAQEPPRPAALHLRPSDRLGLGPCGYELEIRPDGSRLRFYGFGEIGRLCDRDYRVPAGHEARCAEVVAAHFAWTAECRAVKDRIGLTAAEDAEDAADDELRRIEAALVDTTPATLAGLGAKARWATGDDKAPSLRERWTARIAADVVALAERGGAPS